MPELTCDCGKEYEIRDETPGYSAAWIFCPDCYLADSTFPGEEQAHA